MKVLHSSFTFVIVVIVVTAIVALQIATAAAVLVRRVNYGGAAGAVYPNNNNATVPHIMVGGARVGIIPINMHGHQPEELVYPSNDCDTAARLSATRRKKGRCLEPASPETQQQTMHFSFMAASTASYSELPTDLSVVLLRSRQQNCCCAAKEGSSRFGDDEIILKETSSSSLTTQTDSIFAIQAHPDDSVSDLKRQIESQYGIELGLVAATDEGGNNSSRRKDRDGIATGWELIVVRNFTNSTDKASTPKSKSTSTQHPTTMTFNEVLSYHLFLNIDYQIEHGDIIYAVIRNDE